MKSHFFRGGPPGGRQAARGFSLIESLIALVLSALLLTSLFSIYYAAARGAATNANRLSESREARMISHRLSRDIKLVGLVAPLDCDGDADDLYRDVPGQPWSDSLRQDVEHANTYDIVFTCDVDDDGTTETVRYVLDANTSRLMQHSWKWSRASVAWSGPVVRAVADHVEHILFIYYDRMGGTVPNPVQYPVGGYSLVAGERMRVTAVEVFVVTRSERAENANVQQVFAPDGRSWADGFHRTIQRFTVRGRNLNLSG